jgi:acyl carrier protein
MASATNDIVEMIMSRSKYTGGVPQLSMSLDNLGLDSMEAVALAFDIEEKSDIEIPLNANMDIKGKTLADLIRTVDQIIVAKAKPA